MSAHYAREVIRSLRQRWSGRRAVNRFVTDDVLDPRQMAHTVKREQARADRTGRSCSVILFRGNDRADADRKMKKLAAALRRCIRDTDALGYFDVDTLCVVLPDTDAEGAGRLADRIRRAKLRHSPALTSLAVQTYHGSDRSAPSLESRKLPLRTETRTLALRA